MNFLEIVNKIIDFFLSIVRRSKRREQQEKKEEIFKEVDELQKLYEKALREGNVSDITYYRNLIDRRLRNS